ncbi:MAG: hypothetical protein FD137_1748 [Spirochaetes bacterium]|nr:MAG: hypothetical protein FD137_1748 [Spirochaetota bacterium]
MGLLHFKYHNTNCFALRSSIPEEYLAIDAGWPRTLREYQRNLKALGADFRSLRYCLATHFHMDHAGLVGEFLATPSHSPDSVSYICPEAEAIVGELCPLDQIMNDPASLEDWERLRTKGARRIFPSHAGFFEI